MFLQKVGGAGAFLPTPTPPPEVIAATEFGYDLKIGATLGPRVRGVKLATIDGQIQGGSLVSGCADTAARPDPTKLEAVAKLAPLEQFVRAGLAEVNITQRACIYPGTGAAAVAIEGVLDGSISFVNNALAYRGITTGFISSAGASYEGDVSINLPALPDLDGKAIVSSIGVAACTDLFFFEGGFAHLWGGSSVPQTFSGCDLGPYRVLQRSPAPRPQARAGGPRAAAADTVNLPAGLPHAAFSAAGAAGPPLVRLSGPGGVELDSPADGSPLLNDSVVILPVAHEKTTYVVVNDPKAGNWEITGAEAANPISELRLAEGLPEPRVKGKVRASRGGGRRKGKGSSSRSKPKSKPGKPRFSYRLRPIPGQKVIFTERGEGIASELGKARGRRGTISFKPTTALDRKRTIEAEVIQDGFPRALITVAKFKAPKPPKLRKPKLRAKRTKNAVKASWRSVPGASRYLAALSAGRETLYRVLTKKSKLRFKRTPKKGKLKLTVQALSEVQAPGPTAKLKLRPAKRSAHKRSH